MFTVCDNAAGETCPIWPGQPMTAHWGIADPAAVQGPPIEVETAFVTAFKQMRNRISAFVALPLDKLEASTLKAKLRGIGGMAGASASRPEVA